MAVQKDDGMWEQRWVDYLEIDGVIDMLTGGYSTSQQKVVEDSTHILITDVVDIQKGDRVITNGNWYDVMYVDNPLNMDDHLEIELMYRDEVKEDG